MTPRRLRLELAPSPNLAIVIVALHAAAAACVWLALPGAAGVAVAALVLALGAVAAWDRALLRSASSVRVLELDEATPLMDGSTKVSERRYVTRFLVVLPPLAPMRRTIVVTADMLDADSFRRLRIWALWGKLPVVAAKQLAAPA